MYEHKNVSGIIVEKYYIFVMNMIVTYVNKYEFSLIETFKLIHLFSKAKTTNTTYIQKKKRYKNAG